MDIIQFQNKLKEIQTLAFNNGKKVKADLVKQFFLEDGLEEDKLGKVFDYLEVQGIQVEGDQEKREHSQEEGKGAPEGREEKRSRIPLSPEEEEYLNEYMEAFQDVEEDRDTLLDLFLRGQQQMENALIKSYQKEILEAARDYNREEIFFGDLLQEGNMGFLTALGSAEISEVRELDTWLQTQIRKAMGAFIDAQSQQKKEDEILVEKVRDLEARVKELTEDEDVKYSVEELAAFLDMDMDEMEGVLRLAGESPEN